MFLNIAEGFSFNLPVYLPFIFALLSIIAGIASSKIELSLKELLKVHGDMTLGLFSFVTWAFVTYIQNNIVALNSDNFIEISHILFLLLINFALLLISVIAIRHDWANSKLNRIQWFAKTNVDNWINALVLIVSIFCAFLPLLLVKPIIKPKETLKGFEVVIPYQDYSLINHIGLNKWGSRKLCEIQNVTSQDSQSAIRDVLLSFNKNSNSQPIINQQKKGMTFGENQSTIVILKDQIIVNQ